MPVLPPESDATPSRRRARFDRHLIEALETMVGVMAKAAEVPRYLPMLSADEYEAEQTLTELAQATFESTEAQDATRPTNDTERHGSSVLQFVQTDMRAQDDARPLVPGGLPDFVIPPLQPAPTDLQVESTSPLGDDDIHNTSSSSVESVIKDEVKKKKRSNPNDQRNNIPVKNFSIETAYKPQDRVAAFIEVVPRFDYHKDMKDAAREHTYLPTNRLIIHIAREPEQRDDSGKLIPPCNNMIVGSTVNAGSLQSVMDMLNELNANPTLLPGESDMPAIQALRRVRPMFPLIEQSYYREAVAIITSDDREVRKHMTEQTTDWKEYITGETAGQPTTADVSYDSSLAVYKLSQHDLERLALLKYIFETPVETPAIKMLGVSEMKAFSCIPVLQNSFSRIVITVLPELHKTDIMAKQTPTAAGKATQAVDEVKAPAMQPAKKKQIAQQIRDYVRKTLQDANPQSAEDALRTELSFLHVLDGTSGNATATAAAADDDTSGNATATAAAADDDDDDDDDDDTSATAAPKKPRAKKQSRKNADPYPDDKPLIRNLLTLNDARTPLRDSGFEIDLTRFFRRTYGPVLCALNATYGVLIQIGFRFSDEEIKELNNNKWLAFGLEGNLEGTKTIRSHMQIFIEPVRQMNAMFHTADDVMLIHFNTLPTSVVRNNKFIRLPYSSEHYTELPPQSVVTEALSEVAQSAAAANQEDTSQPPAQQQRKRGSRARNVVAEVIRTTGIKLVDTYKRAAPATAAAPVIQPADTTLAEPLLAESDASLSQNARNNSPEPLSPASPAPIQAELASMTSTLFRGATHARLLAALFSHKPDTP